MIRQTTLEAAFPLAEILAKKGLLITAIDTTPISKLLKAGLITMPTRGIDDESFPIEAQILKGSRAEDASGNVTHDVVMEELVNTISSTVRNNLNVARNVVNPIIKDSVAEAEEYLSHAMSLKSTHLQVRPVFFKNIFNMPSLPDMVERFNETPFADINLNIDVPTPVDRDSLIDLAKTGGVNFDGELVSFMSKMTDEALVGTFNSVFGENPVYRKNSLREVCNIDADATGVLLVHLWARKLMTDVPEGVKVSLIDYRSYISSIIAQSGRALLAIINKRESNIKYNRLINTYPPIGSLGSKLLTVEVNGDVYNNWLKEGGSPETLFGAMITDRETGFTALIEKKDNYEKEWAVRERILTTKNRLEKFNEAAAAIESAVATQINDIDSTLLPVEKGVLHARLKTVVGTLEGKFYENMYLTVRGVVCKVMFPHMNAYEILTAMDQVATDFPNLDIREVALLATIEVVSSWCAKLCTLENVAPTSE